jgi:hypothetical protein
VNHVGCFQASIGLVSKHLSDGALSSVPFESEHSPSVRDDPTSTVAVYATLSQASAQEAVQHLALAVLTILPTCLAISICADTCGVCAHFCVLQGLLACSAWCTHVAAY